MFCAVPLRWMKRHCGAEGLARQCQRKFAFLHNENFRIHPLTKIVAYFTQVRGRCASATVTAVTASGGAPRQNSAHGNPLSRASRPGQLRRGRLRPAQRARPTAVAAAGRVLARARDAVRRGHHRHAKRHRQTWEGIAEGLGLCATTSCPGRGSTSTTRCRHRHHPSGKAAKPDSPEMYRHHFRLLRDGLGAWMQGRTAPVGMPSYVDFLAGVTTRARPCARQAPRRAGAGGLQRRADQHRGRPCAGHQPRNHDRAQPAHPQHGGHRVRLHAQAPHAGDLQHAAAPQRPGLRGLGDLRRSGPVLPAASQRR